MPNAWRDRNKRRQREISLEYLTEEKFYPFSTTDNYFIDTYKQYPVLIYGQRVILTNGNLADMIPLEAMQPPRSPALIFPGLEIRLHQRRVLKDGADIYLTRLEYGALCYLAASPGRVFTKAQIFESVWSMESESCQ